MTNGTLRALSRLSVLDASTGIAGPYAASLLAGMGARVRRLPPAAAQSPDGERPPQTEGLRRYLRQGVEQLLDPAAVSPAALLGECDILIASDERLGTAASLVQQFPRLTVVSVTPFGLSGPERNRPGTAFTAAAKAGWLYITGEPGSEPLRVGGNVTELAAGWAALSGALLGIWRRARTGAGSLLDIALLEVFVWLGWMATQRAAYEGITVERAGGRGAGHPWGVYRCRDGHVIVIVGAGGRNWGAFADLMELPELHDPKYATPRARAQYADEIDALMYRWLSRQDARTVYERAQAAGLPFGMIATVPDLLDDAQLAARDFLLTDEDGIRRPGLPFLYNGERPRGGTHAGVPATSVRGGMS